MIGDEVSLAFGFFDRDAAGTYDVTRLLPTSLNGEPQYRIKGKDDRERVIGEGQIMGNGHLRNAKPRSSHNPITAMFDRLDRAK
ncbi:hypothetical protein AB4Z16_25475 [Bosea sp. TAF32]